MRHAELLVLSSVLLVACDDESAPISPPDPAPVSWLSVCEGQPELGDTWQLERFGMDIQLDAEGNVYLIGSDFPECAAEPETTKYLSEHVTKIGARGDVRWVRSWQQDYTPIGAVAPSGRSMVLGGGGVAFLVDGDGQTLVERENRSGAFELGASSADFLLAGIYGGGAMRFDGARLELANEGIFVIALDDDLVPRVVLEPTPEKAIPIDVVGVIGLSDGDVVTAQTDETEPDSTVLMRIGSHPWRALIPLQSEDVRLFALQDDSIVVQVGPTVSRFASDGTPLWSREYADSLHADPSDVSRRSWNAAMYAAAGVDRVVIAFTAYPSEGPLETSEGSILPDGQDVGFATIDVETGLVEHVTLESAPGDQFISGPVLSRDGAIVARLSSIWEETGPSGPARRGGDYIVRRRLGL